LTDGCLDCRFMLPLLEYAVDRLRLCRAPTFFLLVSSAALTMPSCMPADGVRPGPQEEKESVARPKDPSRPMASRGQRAPLSETVTAREDDSSLALRDSVAHVIDGDTIVGRNVGKVRLIGINTPELRAGRSSVGCFGSEAAQRMRELLPEGTAIQLRLDVERHDKYGRLLAYVYREGDGVFVNATLVEEGYAMVATIPPNVAHVNQLLDLQSRARDSQRGLWSRCLESDRLGSYAGVRR
jgi:endonuclease YncB( thermonuclease family)